MIIPIVKKTVVTRIPPDVQALLSVKTTEIRFTHVDPTYALARMLITGPLASDPSNLELFPKLNTPYYDDYADGERLARIDATLPAGAAALTSILFFDEINRDAKGFATGDGAIIVGGFFNRYPPYTFHPYHAYSNV
jgi:hypothetical protein